jgi:FlaA1/EpsC-like NDP-sugar epimerase
VAIPSATAEQRRDILNICKETGCKLTNLPGMYQLALEQITVKSMKDVEIEDLLGREPIKVNMDEIFAHLTGKVILVTGGGGSIGSELCRQVASHNPKQLIVFDIYENNAHAIQLELRDKYPNLNLVVLIGSVRDSKRINQVFETYKPDIVYHAAAHKHVPLMEDSPVEAIRTNVIGTYNVARLANKYYVKKLVLVSTDKAVNPTNVMGCSKRICEIYVQALGKTCQTQFVTTRFGNVLGSNGSVIPLFKEQIKNGGPVTVTDERIVRYFMLIPEACKLVLEAGTKGNGGEIFVFDMGKPVRIADLAKRMIKLSGAKNVEIKYTGLRPGEKLYEEVLNDKEGTKPTFHSKIRIAEVRSYEFAQVSKDIDELIDISKHYDNMATVKKMKEIVPEYKSNNSVYEELDHE